jgi:tetratricopeptide (TPR) repeat protein
MLIQLCWSADSRKAAFYGVRENQSMHFEYQDRADQILRETLGGDIDEFEFRVKRASKDDVDQVSVYPLTGGLSGAATFLVRRVGKRGRLSSWVVKVCNKKELINAERENYRQFIEDKVRFVPKLIDESSLKLLIFKFGGALGDHNTQTLRSGYTLATAGALKSLMERLVNVLHPLHKFSDDSAECIRRMTLNPPLDERLRELKPQLPVKVVNELCEVWHREWSTRNKYPCIRSTAHGDLNAGNILFEPGSDASYPVLIDFASMLKQDGSPHYPPFWDYAKVERDIKTRLFLKEAEGSLSVDAILEVVEALDRGAAKPSVSSLAVDKLWTTVYELRKNVQKKHPPDDFNLCYRLTTAYATLQVFYRQQPDRDLPLEVQYLIAARSVIALLSGFGFTPAHGAHPDQFEVGQKGDNTALSSAVSLDFRHQPLMSGSGPQTHETLSEPGPFDLAANSHRKTPPFPGAPAQTPSTGDYKNSTAIEAPFIGISTRSLEGGFKGRDRDLEELHASLQGSGAVSLTSGKPGHVFAHGGGGIGKSRLAIEYAYRYRNAYPGGVLFTRAERRGPQEIWAGLARKLFIGQNLPQDDDACLALVQRFVDAKWGRHLVILDDVQADTREELAKRFRERIETQGQLIWPIERSQVSLLMTTRIRDIPWAQGFAVDRLTPESATSLLLDKANVKSPEGSELAAATELASEVLGGHPLAISLAGAYIRRGDFLFSQYLQFLQEKGVTDRLEEAARRVGSEIGDHERSIAATYELSRKQLNAGLAEDVLAEQLLQIAAFLEPGLPIDRKMLLRIVRASGQATGEEEIGLALARLTKDLALLDPGQNSGFGPGDVLIHPLIADYTRWCMEESVRHNIQRALLVGLSSLFPRQRNDFWKICQQGAHQDWEWLSPIREAHANAVLSRSAPLIVRARGNLALGLGILYSLRGNWESARRACGESLNISRRLTEQDRNQTEWQEDLAWSLNRLGDVLIAEGDRTGARSAYREAADTSRNLAERDPNHADWQRDMAWSLHKLGDVLRENGDLVGARETLMDALDISRRLAEREPNRAEWQRAVAWNLTCLGDVLNADKDQKGARNAYQDALEISRRLVERDPNHAEWQRAVALSLNSLGDTLLAAGDKVGARNAYEEAFVIAQSLVERNPADAQWLGELQGFLSDLVNFLSAGSTSERDEARKLLVQVQGTLGRLAADNRLPSKRYSELCTFIDVRLSGLTRSDSAAGT